MAGLLQRRLIGPIYKDGVLVTAIWVGDPADPEGGKDDDVTRSVWTTVTASFLIVTLAVIALADRTL
ncbi:MAG: hypothetical protein DMG11_25430 [Acidobacteria bacterium]|nr:MAG: hypothetical protein DMG11_25430 [Acidobacteriota bacterium]